MNERINIKKYILSLLKKDCVVKAIFAYYNIYHDSNILKNIIKFQLNMNASNNIFFKINFLNTYAKFIKCEYIEHKTSNSNVH